MPNADDDRPDDDHADRDRRDGERRDNERSGGGRAGEERIGADRSNADRSNVERPDYYRRDDDRRDDDRADDLAALGAAADAAANGTDVDPDEFARDLDAKLDELGQDPFDWALDWIVPRELAKKLERAFGMRTVGDLILHLPRRHGSRGALSRITGLERDTHVTLVAEVVSANKRPMRQRRGTIVEAVITDGFGTVKLTWFGQPWRLNDLTPGSRGLFSGKVSYYGGQPQLTHPDYELFDDDQDILDEASEASAKAWARTPIPIYPATSTIPSWEMARIIDERLDRIPHLADPVPAEVRAARGELDFDTAIRRLHRPDSEEGLEAARQALKFTEALELQTILAQQRARSAEARATPRRRTDGGLTDRLDLTIPFQLTDDQLEVGATIGAELAGTVPMHRLLQGEVGSGKTIVAVRAMLQVAESGGQSALLAPTEVLAGQHFRSIVETLGPELTAELKPVLLTGALGRRERQEALLGLVTGESKIAVGTHALLSEGVEFDDLSLVVIDEQHRFGVEQREALRRKSRAAAHTLVLTATPIPRTVAMTAFGDLDTSTIRALPAGRAGISTHVVALADHPAWIERVWQRTAEELDRGRQAFVVCPAIAPGEPEEATGRDPDLDAEEPARPLATVAEISELLRSRPEFAGRVIATLHGGQHADEKDAAMRAFAAGQIDVLVATTVIEVGVNVPNASVMVVLDADRFGVSQLHQLRGRVGRGQWPGLCLLVTHAPAVSLARERVDAVAATTDGFELAERDLELRREGDVLGTRQSGGQSSLKLLRVTKDADIIDDARRVAQELVAADPTLDSVPALKAAVARIGRAARDHLAMG